MAKRHKDELERVEVLDRAELRAWLEANHQQTQGIWLISHKKASPQYLEYGAIVEEALCFGWIDSTARGLDQMRSMLMLTPRRPGSAWSRPNKIRIERLLEDGRMHAAGLARIEQAKQDGSWTFLDDIEALVVPPDLQEALEAHPPGMEHWEGYPRTVKRHWLAWIKTAKRPETRAKRVAEVAEKAQRNERPRQP